MKNRKREEEESSSCRSIIVTFRLDDGAPTDQIKVFLDDIEIYAL